MEGHEKAPLYQPGRALTRNHTGHNLDPGLPASKNYYKNKFLLFKPPSLWHFAWQPVLTQQTNA